MALNGIAVAPRYRQTGRYIQAMGRLAPPDSLDGVEREFEGGLGSRPAVRREDGPGTWQRHAAQRIPGSAPGQNQPQRMIAALPGFRCAGVGGALEVWLIIRGTGARRHPRLVPLRCIQATGLRGGPHHCSLDGVERDYQGGLGSRPGVRRENDPRHLATMQRNAFQGPRRARIDLGA